MKENAIEINQLTKKYHQFAAIEQISLQIPKGEIFGLIGQNGAGKSTLMKILSGMIHQTSGDFKLFGHYPNDDHYLYHRVGSLIEQPGLLESLTAFDNMKVKALALGCYSKKEIEELLKICKINNTGNKKVKSFSLGMRQRLAVAMSLINDPDLLILDEPTNGLDPQGFNEMRELLIRLNRERGKTILISSHILTELSKIASSYGIISHGKLVECLDNEQLKQRCQSYLLLKVAPVDQTVRILEEELKINDYKVIDNKTVHLFSDVDSALIIEKLVKNDILVYECTYYQKSLEQYFLSVSGGNSND